MKPFQVELERRTEKCAYLCSGPGISRELSKALRSDVTELLFFVVLNRDPRFDDVSDFILKMVAIFKIYM
jgi:hypothetical protein